MPTIPSISYEICKRLKEAGFPQQGELYITQTGKLVTRNRAPAFSVRYAGSDEVIAEMPGVNIETVVSTLGGDTRMYRAWDTTTGLRSPIYLSLLEALAELYILTHKK